MHILSLLHGHAAFAIFLLALALLPLVFAWRDSRGRAQGRARLRKLRREAGVTERLRAPSGYGSLPR